MGRGLALRALAELDGHPDNAAACATAASSCATTPPTANRRHRARRGRLARPARRRPRAASCRPRPRARRCRRRYERADVVRAVSAASLLVGGLIGGHAELVEDALHCDVLHEPHRAALVPELAEVREAATHTRALGATLSGAGPSVLVWCEPDTVEQAVGALSIDFPEHELLALRCASSGARLED